MPGALNKTWQLRAREFRDRFALTPKETRVVIFILLACVLGFAVEIYRSRHASVTRPTDPKHPWRKMSNAAYPPKIKHKRQRDTVAEVAGQD